jgi:oxygen-independent coproporphyrinogen-3 oxidase
MRSAPEKAGLYIHVPFCRRKCPYCHFASAPPREGDWETWREGIEREAALRSRPEIEFETLYFGGGTPSLLDPADISGLIAALGRRLRLRIAEFTLEANPAAGTDDATLARWAGVGVTRLSVGVQSFDDATLAVLGRDYAAADALSFLSRARRAGFEAIGIDLMAGVPGESRASLRRTLEAVERAGPDHVSVYLLENVEGLPFEAVLAENPVDDDAAASAFEYLAAGLGSLGLARYEISNFARPGFECRHNLKYWRGEPFLGLGPSAGSRIGAERWTNAAGLAAWSQALATGADPRAEGVVLDPERNFREAIVAGLRLVAGIDLAEFQRRFGVDVGARFEREIAELWSDGLITLEGGILRIPEDRLLVSNRVMAAFV